MTSRFYQEFLGKTLTEKYTSLNAQMDKVVHNANTEIATLQSKLSGTPCSLEPQVSQLSILRNAGHTRAAREEKPRTRRPLPRQMQKVHPDHKSLQSA